jgi:hypothetical protein
MGNTNIFNIKEKGQYINFWVKSLMEIKTTRQMQTFMEDIKTDNWKPDCGNTVSRHSSVAGFCGVVTSYFATEYSLNRTSMLRKNRGDLSVKGQFVYLLILWCCTAVPGNMWKNYCEWTAWLENAHRKILFQDPARKHKYCTFSNLIHTLFTVLEG